MKKYTTYRNTAKANTSQQDCTLLLVGGFKL